FYHLHPALDRRKAALLQVWVWIAATLTLTAGVALVHSGHPAAEPLAAGGSLIILADMLLFGWLVYQREAPAAAAAPLARRTRHG
ncbi:MAG TPA: hypothetical protein VFF88_07280, partial [Methylocella sp.]|nr:hypothetical protein [Methylocella sp.]